MISGNNDTSAHDPQEHGETWSWDPINNKNAHIKEEREAARAPKVTAASLPYPHKWINWLRGVPMFDPDNPSIQLPGMSLPLEAVHCICAHLEMVGFTDPDPALQKIYHYKPEHGPDIFTNPGEWKDTPPPPDIEAARTVTAEEVQAAIPDLTGASPVFLEAVKKAADEERIRQLKLANADAQVVVEEPNDIA